MIRLPVVRSAPKSDERLGRQTESVPQAPASLAPMPSRSGTGWLPSCIGSVCHVGAHLRNGIAGIDDFDAQDIVSHMVSNINISASQVSTSQAIGSSSGGRGSPSYGQVLSNLQSALQQLSAVLSTYKSASSH
jgi:hypothetical protein